MSVQSNSLDEPRSVVQQLATKFNMEPDITIVSRINSIFNDINKLRMKKLSNSRNVLHRNIPSLFYRVDG